MGIGIALFTFGSYLLPFITDWHDESTVTREVFDNIPDAIKLGFYTVIPVTLIWGAWAFSNRMKNWERGRPDNRRTTTKNVKRRASDFRAGVYMQTLLRDAGAGLMHSMIYFGFLVLLGVTTVLEIDHQLPEQLKFLHGTTYKAYAFVGDLAGLVFLAGIVWAIIRRYVQRPYRIRIKSKPEHAAILGTFFAVGVTGFGAEMFRIAEEGMRFTDYYGDQSCTAGRSSFITGQTPLRTGLSKVGLPGAELGITDRDITIAEVLKTEGYATGQFGKNHLGDKDENLPTNHGFDEFLGNLYHLNAEEEPEDVDYPQDPTFRKMFGPRGVIHSYADGRIEDTGALTRKRMETADEEFAAAAQKFIDKSVKADKPFFVWLNTTGMHFRTHPAKKHLGKSGQDYYNDVMVAHDELVGLMLDQLD